MDEQTPDREPADLREPDEPAADPQWFRAPSRRERWIAAALFAGFGIFFLALFFLHRDWWFRWVILGLGLISLLVGVRHASDARGANA